MDVQLPEKDYALYTFEAFLQDDFFLSSMTHPDERSIAFWNDFQQTNPANLSAFNAARAFLQSYYMRSQHNPVAHEKLSSLWCSILENTKKKNEKAHARKRLYLRIGAVAACVTTLLVASFFFTSRLSERMDDSLMVFVQQNPVQIDNLFETQLTLSTDRVVQVKERESEIVYGVEEIKVSTTQESLTREKRFAFNQLAVPKGKRATLTLSDGTLLCVNAGSVVSYPWPFTGEKREIYVDGEIFIRVAKDIDKPFIVRTSDVDVHVTGTEFNVLAYEEDREKRIVLANGAVKVRSRKDKAHELVLIPSQMYCYDKQKGKGYVSTVELDKHIAWKEGAYLFESERLDVVMRRLSRYYGEKIICNTEIADMRCSGRMNLDENLLDILNGLAFSFPIHVTCENNIYLITSR